MANFDVLMPVRNGIAFLSESIDSIQKQTVCDWRLLLLDHGSTDGSLELAQAYGETDARIRVLTFPDAPSLAALLNLGLDRADCRYLVRHDADDICYPRRLRITADAFSAAPQCVAIGGQADVIDSNGASLGVMTLPVGTRRIGASCFFRNPIAHPASAFDFQALRRLGISYGRDFLGILPEGQRLHAGNLAEDYQLFGQLALLGRCDNVSETLIKYRRHGSNVGIRRYHQQMLTSLAVSRYLAASLCARLGVQPFDPAPFCTFGDALMSIDGRTDFEEDFEKMAGVIRTGFGCSAEVERELSFRKVVSTRRSARLVCRYLQFAARHRPDESERRSIRSWVTRHLSRNSPVTITSDDPHDGQRA